MKKIEEKFRRQRFFKKNTFTVVEPDEIMELKIKKEVYEYYLDLRENKSNSDDYFLKKKF